MQDFTLLTSIVWLLVLLLLLLALFLGQALHRLARQRGILALNEQRFGEASKGLESETARRQVAEEDLRRSLHHLRNLGRQLLSIQEDERERIASRIHDDFGQRMTALKLDLAWLEPRVSLQEEATRSRWAEMLSQIDVTIHLARQIATELKPRVLDEFGLEAAIEWQVRDLQDRSDLSCRFICDLVAGARFLPDLEITLFRILQELLVNVIRHAQADRLQISLKECRDRLILVVADDGLGLVPEAMTAAVSFGLLQMKERVRYWGGTVEVSSSPGGGTTIEIDLPAERR